MAHKSDIEIAREANKKPIQEIGAKLTEWTGERWIAILSREIGDLPIRAQRDQAAQAEMDEVLRSPMVLAVSDLFPDAEVVSVKTVAELAAPAPAEEALPAADDGDDDDLEDEDSFA